jgi:hypothetical protein
MKTHLDHMREYLGCICSLGELSPRPWRATKMISTWHDLMQEYLRKYLWHKRRWEGRV